MWRKIHAIRGIKRHKKSPNINNSTNPTQKANNLAKHFSKVSSNSNFSKKFQDKLKKETKFSKENRQDNLEINQPYTIEELNHVLNNRKKEQPLA